MQFKLPQLEIIADTPTQSPLILVGGGRAPNVNWLRRVADGRPVWCIDHGIDICRQADILPKRLIGDNDSATVEAWNWARNNSVKTECFPREKDFTDTQLALSIADRESADTPPFIILTGSFGGRFDHLLSTAFSFSTMPLNGIMADGQEFLLPLKGPASVTITFFKKPAAISLLPVTEKCLGVTAKGLKWELADAQLLQSNPYSVSNELKKDTDTIKVSIKNGITGVYAFWK